MNTFFTGESERKIVDAQGFSDQVMLRPGSFKLEELPAGGITEQDRLSYVVNSIENQCQIVPLGSYKKNTLGEVSQNDAFRGLKYNDATSLKSYLHLRPVQQKEKQDMADREDDIFANNFLDCADAGSQGFWTVQRDDVNKAVVVLRSRVWPGYSAYTRANTPVYGGVYIGDGICNSDLPFMI